MDVFFYSLVIVGCVLFIKLLIIICVYMCRAKRLQQQQQRQATERNDAGLYPSAPYNQNSPFVNFEESPQPVMTVSPGETPQGLLPGMMPPPYTLAVDDKPPAYADIYKPPPGGSTSRSGDVMTGTAAGSGDVMAVAVDTGMECLPAQHQQNIQPSVPDNNNVLPAPAVLPVPAVLQAPAVHNASHDAIQIVVTDEPTPRVRVGNLPPTPTAPEGICVEEDDRHATVSPGGGIAVV